MAARGGRAARRPQSQLAAPAPWTLVLIAAALLAQTCLAAVQHDGSPARASAGIDTSGPTLWQRYEALFPAAQLVPTVTHIRGHEVAYQVPGTPRGTLFIAPGCSHAAHDWWPASPACPTCLGLPEEVAHTQQALARGYAVIAMSSKNAHGDMCMDWSTNFRDAVAILTSFRAQHGLDALPLYGVGVSVGGGFVAKLAAYIKMDGVVSEVLGPMPEEWHLSRYHFGIPPIVFISMDQDPPMAARISGDSARLRRRGAIVETVRVAPRVVHPTFFSDRSSRVSPEVSVKVVAALHQIGMLDEAGYVTADPRHTRRPWVRQLVRLVPELDGGMTEDHSHVWEEMNLAWSTHEIIADFTTAALMWFESGAKADFGQLVAKYGAQGHSGQVADAAGAIPPPAALAALGPPPAPQRPKVLQPYERHEARASLPAAAQQAAQPPTAVAIQQGSGSAAEQASYVRVLGATTPQQKLRPLIQQIARPPPQQQQEMEENGSALLPLGMQASARQSEQASGTVSAASLTAAQPQSGEAGAAAAPPTAAAEPQAKAAGNADAAVAAVEGGGDGSGLSPLAILGCTGGAVVGIGLLLGLYLHGRKPAGFNKLPLSEPPGAAGRGQAAEPLPVSTRLPPIPELPDAAHGSSV